MKTIYYYVFYRLYKLWEKDPHLLFSAHYRADICLMALELWSVFCIVFTYATVRSIDLREFINTPIGIALFVLPLVLIFCLNIYVFSFSKEWKVYIDKFEKWPKGKNRMWSFFVWLSIVLITISFFSSVYYYQKIVLKM